MVLLRDGDQGPELLLTVRPAALAFMGGAAVFPGGAVAPSDRDRRWERASALGRSEAAAALGVEDADEALGYFVCALREAFEEVGFLIGSGPLDRLERSASDDPERWLALCLDLRVVLGTDLLVPAGRSITPEGSPIRFDTRFFATRAPEGWEPRSDPSEVERCLWLSPQRAVEELGHGRLHMAPPTIEVLHRLARAGSVEDMLEELRRSAASSRGLHATALHPLVQVALAPNAGIMTGPGTNTYIVGPPGGPSVVIDPAVDDDQFLQVVLESSGALRGIVVTHRHPDHIGGVGRLAELTGAPVYAYGEDPIAGVRVTPVRDADRVTTGSMSLRVVHTPGHASDHICLQLDDALFSGDTLLGEGTAVIAPPDGDMGAYMASLRRLRALPIERIFPGHFRARSDAPALIDEYLEHRLQRERAIIAALGEDGATIEEIVRRVYADTSPALHHLAAYSVSAHLEMAAADGRVRSIGDRWVVAGSRGQET